MKTVSLFLLQFWSSSSSVALASQENGSNIEPSKEECSASSLDFHGEGRFVFELFYLTISDRFKGWKKKINLMKYDVLNDGEGTLVRLCEKRKSVLVKKKVNSHMTHRSPSVQYVSLSTKSTLSPTWMVCCFIVCFLF